MGLITVLAAIYILLGAIFDAIAAMVITLPFVFPLVTQSLGFDPIWWGIAMIVVIEIGMITPPIGINVFVMHGVRPDISLSKIFRGILPFLGADLFRPTMLILFPFLALWLPYSMYPRVGVSSRQHHSIWPSLSDGPVRLAATQCTAMPCVL